MSDGDAAIHCRLVWKRCSQRLRVSVREALAYERNCMGWGKSGWGDGYG
ncbi:MAG: hypothetical protein AB8I69_22620 [Anaerolineae bacterium]